MDIEYSPAWKLTVILKPFKAEQVVDMLHAAGLFDVWITEVRGYGRQKGYLDSYRNEDAGMTFVPKVRLEFFVGDRMRPGIEKKIREIACTGRIGDGKIFETRCMAVEAFIAGERGSSAGNSPPVNEKGTEGEHVPGNT